MSQLKISYKEAVDYFRSAVSYLPILKESDTRATTQWMHVDRELYKNLSKFYREYVSKIGSEEEKKEFLNYVEHSKPKKKKTSKKGKEQGEG